MDPILIGSAALGVGVLGLLTYVWRIVSTRTVSFSMLWLIVPLTGAMIAFLMAPPNLTAITLGGTTLVLTLLTVGTPVVVPVLLEPAPVERSESSRAEDRRD